MKKQVLTEFSLDKLLGVLSKDKRTKTGVRPNAETFTLLQSPSDEDRELMTFFSKVNKLAVDYPLLYNLCQIMIDGSLRCSEALSIRYWNITRAGMVIIDARKYGQNRIIVSSICRKFLLECKEARKHPFQDLTYNHVYRQLKARGITFQPRFSSKKAVTHSFRHLTTKAVKAVTDDKQIIAQQLGQRSTKSQEYYG